MFLVHLALTAVLVIVCAVLLFLVLIQRSKGEGLGGAFGMGGGSETVLGSRVSVLQKYTAILVGVFMGLCLIISLLPPVKHETTNSLLNAPDNVPSQSAPAVPGAGAAAPEAGAGAGAAEGAGSSGE